MMGIEQRDDQRGGGGYYVRRPRSTDALGTSLRHAFGEASRLPDEMSKSLAALDRATARH